MRRKPTEWLLRQHNWVPEISTTVIGIFLLAMEPPDQRREKSTIDIEYSMFISQR